MWKQVSPNLGIKELDLYSVLSEIASLTPLDMLKDNLIYYYFDLNYAALCRLMNRAPISRHNLVIIKSLEKLEIVYMTYKQSYLQSEKALIGSCNFLSFHMPLS